MSNGGTRTVQLVGGSRLLSNSTAAFAAGTMLYYNTTWAGALNVDGGTAGGGEFDLFRDNGGIVSVSSGASINIINGATVNVGGTETYGTLLDESGGTNSGNSVNFSGTGGTGMGHLVFSRSADTTPDNSLSYGGNISGNLDLTQKGSDTLILSGSNSYNGGTFVTSGTLAIVAPMLCPRAEAFLSARAATCCSARGVASPRISTPSRGSEQCGSRTGTRLPGAAIGAGRVRRRHVAAAASSRPLITR